MKTRRFRILALTGLLALLAAAVFVKPILGFIGRFPVVDGQPVKADAVVVLYTGVDYYPRLIEAARLYTEGFAETVVINGNRKTDVLRSIERMGYRPCCHWAEDYIRILQLHGVAKGDIVAVSAEDAFDTITEAEAVGGVLLDRKIERILLTTSKFHTRRARYIWRSLFGNRIRIDAVAARSDPYDPAGWWKHGRQVRWVMAEYGAWGYYLWQKVAGGERGMRDET